MTGAGDTSKQEAAECVASALLNGHEAWIQEMVRRIVEGFHPEKIVLLGSHARGNAGPESDVDPLVIMDVPGSVREERIRIRVALHDIPVPKDVFVATPDQVRRFGHRVGTIPRPALREGRVLYARS